MSNTPKRKSKAGTRTAPPRTRTMTTQKGPSPWPKLLGYLGGAAVVAVILGAILFAGGDEDVPEGPPEGVVAVQVGDPLHVEGDIDYGTAVPAGGQHNPIWQNCGFYDGPVRAENAVHSLEHGAVWITYRQDLGESAIGSLRGLVGNRPQVLASEVPDQAAPLIATAWGFQLELGSYDDTALRRFIRAFEDAVAPEPRAGCTGGVGNPA